MVLAKSTVAPYGFYQKMRCLGKNDFELAATPWACQKDLVEGTVVGVETEVDSCVCLPWARNKPEETPIVREQAIVVFETWKVVSFPNLVLYSGPDPVNVFVCPVTS